MRTASGLAALVIWMFPTLSPASPEAAQRIEKSWQLAMENWQLELRAATTPAVRDAVMQKRPDPVPRVREMWSLIQPSLSQTWVLEPAVWFLRMAPGLRVASPNGSTVSVFESEVSTLLETIGKTHLKSPGLIPVCIALAEMRDPRTLKLLESIQTGHPDVKTQGVAALSTAMILRSLGDDANLIRKRLACLRKAIIDSSDVDFGNGVTVAKLAEDELHIIRHLSKGRTAPDLSGTDSAGRAIRLSDYSGKVVILMFWHSSMPEATHAIEITNEMTRKFEGKPVVVLGVNRDPLDKLRSLEADRTVTWRSFSDPKNQLAREYRIGVWPMVYVLDGERKVQFTGSPGSFVELTADALVSEMQPAGKR